MPNKNKSARERAMELMLRNANNGTKNTIRRDGSTKPGSTVSSNQTNTTTTSQSTPTSQSTNSSATAQKSPQTAHTTSQGGSQGTSYNDKFYHAAGRKYTNKRRVETTTPGSSGRGKTTTANSRRTTAPRHRVDDEVKSDRPSLVVGGAAKQWAGGHLSGIGTGVQSDLITLNSYRDAALNSALKEEEERRQNPGKRPSSTDKSSFERYDPNERFGTKTKDGVDLNDVDRSKYYDLSAKDSDSETYKKIISGTKDMISKGDELISSGGQDIEQAKEGLGSVGKVGVDLVANGVQMLGDRALAFVPGVGQALALGSLMNRAGGTASYEGRQSGMNADQQYQYALGTSLIEGLSEQMFNSVGAFKATYGKGALSIADNLSFKTAAKNIVQNVLKSDTGRAIAYNLARLGGGALEEGTEEVVADLAEPALKYMIMKSTDPNAEYDPTSLKDLGYDFLVGALMGGIPGSVDMIRGVRADVNLANSEAYKAFEDGNAFAQQYMDRAMVQGRVKDNGRILKTDAEVLAEKMQKQIDNGGQVLPGQTRRLMEALNESYTTNETSFRNKRARNYQEAAKKGETNNVVSSGSRAENEEFSGVSYEKELEYEDQARDLMGDNAKEESVEAVGRVLASTADSADVDTVLLDPDAKAALEILAPELQDSNLPVKHAEAREVIENVISSREIATRDSRLQEAQDRYAKNIEASLGNMREGAKELLSSNYQNAVSAMGDGSGGIYKELFNRIYIDGTTKGADFEKTYDNIIANNDKAIQEAFPKEFAKKIFDQGRMANVATVAKETAQAKAAKYAEQNKIEAHIEEAAKKYVDQQTFEDIDKFAKRSKVRVEIVEHIVAKDDNGNILYDENGKELRANGKYENGIIYIAADSDNKFITIAKHELTHHIKEISPERYQELEDFVFQRWYNSDFQAMQDAIVKYQKLYQNITPQQAKEEIIADASEAFFTDEGAIQDVCSFSGKLAKALSDGIHSLLDTFLAIQNADKKTRGLGGQFLKQMNILKDAERMWAEALDESVNTDRDAKNGANADLDTEAKHSLGYHAGDLGKSTGDDYWGIKGRSTGHFGFGTYFVGDKMQISDDYYGKRPLESVDFDKYNLFKPRNYEDGERLHDALKKVNDYIKGYNDFSKYFNIDYGTAEADEWYQKAHGINKDLDDFLWDLSSGETPNADVKARIDKFISEMPESNRNKIDSKAQERYEKDDSISLSDWRYYEAQSVVENYTKEWNEKRHKLQNLAWDLAYGLNFRFSQEEIENALKATDRVISKYDSYKRGLDSASTVFMKQLGYEGVDVRGIKGLDNTSYGSVIYDLKGEDLARKKEIGTAKYSISPSLLSDLESIRNVKPKENTGELLIGTTSDFLMNNFGINSNRVTMSYEKAFANMVTKEEALKEKRFNKNLNYHGLGVNGLYNALYSSENPVFAFVSEDDFERGIDRGDTVALVTDKKDKNGNYIIVYQRLHDDVLFNKKWIKSDKIVTTFSRDNLNTHIENALKNGKMLFADKKRSQAILGITGKRLTSSLNADFNNNIDHFIANVKYLHKEVTIKKPAPATFNLGDKLKEAQAKKDAEEKSNKKNGSYSLSTDSDGNKLTKAQDEYFKDSKVRDKSGNLLVMYHGTDQAGFNTFKVGAMFKGIFFSSSRRTADAYGGNADSKLYNPNERETKTKATVGNFGDTALQESLRDFHFDTKEDYEKFVANHPGIENVRSEYELQRMLDEEEITEDEYDKLRKLLKDVQKDYGKYERDHMGVATWQDLIDNPDAYGFNDFVRAIYAYDREASIDEGYEPDTKESLLEAMKTILAEDEEMRGKDETPLSDLSFAARLPIGQEGEYVNKVNNRTYKTYVNLVNPLIVDANGRNMNEGYYSYLEQGLKDNKYDGVIIKNVRIGKYNDEGYVVVAKEPNQIKLTSNENPTENEDIRFSVSEDSEAAPATKEYKSTIKKLEEQVADLKAEFKRTNLKTADPKQVRIQAGRFLKRHDANNSLHSEVIDTFNKIFGLYKDKGTDAFDEVYEIAQKTAVDVVNSISVIHDEGAEDYKAIKDYLKNTEIKVSDEMKRNITDYTDFRKHNFGRLKLVNGETSNIDNVYMELMEMFPGQFTEDYVNPADQLYHIVDVLDNYAPYYETLDGASEEMQDYVVEIASDIMETAYNLQTKKTFADKKYEQKIKAVKKAREEALASRKKALNRQKERYEKKLEYIKQKKEERRARKKDSEARTKLLNIARRLSKIKSTEEFNNIRDALIGQLDLEAKSMTGRTKMKLEDLQKWYEDQVENNDWFVRNEKLEEKFKRLNKTHIADMSLEDVENLTDILLMLEHKIRNDKKLINSQYQHDVFRAAIETNNGIKESKGLKFFGLHKIDDVFVGQTLSPVRYMRRLVGYDENNPLMIATRELQEGQIKSLDYRMNALKPFNRFSDLKFVSYLNGRKAPEIEVNATTIDMKPTTVKIIPAIRIWFYLSSLNEDNMRHIVNGAVHIPDVKLLKAGKRTDAYDKGQLVRFSKSQVQAIIDGMTEQEKAYAAQVYNYFNNVAPQATNEVSEQLDGITVAKVKNYLRISVDKNFLDVDADIIKRDGTLENMGSHKERVKSSKPVYAEDISDVLMNAIEADSKYVGMAIPIRNFNKIYRSSSMEAARGEAEHKQITGTVDNSPAATNGMPSVIGDEDSVKYKTLTGGYLSVQETIKKMWSSDAIRYIDEFISDLQFAQKPAGVVERALRSLTSNYAGAVLTLNASVAIKQAASFPTAAAVVGWKPLIKSMGRLGKLDLDYVDSVTPLLNYRTEGFNFRETGDIQNRGNRDGFFQRATRAKALNWIQGMDVLTTRKLFKAAQIYVEDNFKLKKGSEAYDKKVAEVYNRIITETQPNYTTMERPGHLRSDSTLERTLSMFKTQPYQNFNIWYDATGNYLAKRAEYKKTRTEENRKALKEASQNLLNATTSQIVQLAVFAAMTSLWALFRRRDDKYKDEDGNITFASYMKQLAKDMLGGASAEIFLGSEVFSAIESNVNGTYYTGFSSVTDSSINDILSSMKDTMTLVGKAFDHFTKGEEAETTTEDLLKQLEKVATEAGRFTGVPTGNVRNLINATYGWVAMAADGKYIGTYEAQKMSFAKDAEMKANLFQAYRNDKTAYDQIRAMMIEDGFKEDSLDKYIKEQSKEHKTDSEQKTYDKSMQTLEGSSLWTSASAEDQARYSKVLEKLAVGIDDGETASYTKKMESGLSAETIILYKLALKKVDKPNSSGNLGTYTNDEKEAALRLLGSGLSSRQKDTLKG